MAGLPSTTPDRSLELTALNSPQVTPGKELGIEKGEGPLPYRPSRLWDRFQLFCYNRTGRFFEKSVAKAKQAFQKDIQGFQKANKDFHATAEQLIKDLSRDRKTQLQGAYRFQGAFFSRLEAFKKVQQGSRSIKKMEEVAEKLGLEKSGKLFLGLNRLEKQSIYRAFLCVSIAAASRGQKSLSPSFLGAIGGQTPEQEALEKTRERSEEELTQFRQTLCLEKILERIQKNQDNVYQKSTALERVVQRDGDEVYSFSLVAEEGESLDLLWKPEQETAGWGRPLSSKRSWASFYLDAILGGNVTVPTRLATYQGAKGMVTEVVEGTPLFFEGPERRKADQKNVDRYVLEQLLHNLPSQDQDWFMKDWLLLHHIEPSSFRYSQGTLYEIPSASGSSRNYFLGLNWKNPQLRRDLVQLQIQDYLMGQKRHPQDVLVQVDHQGRYVGLKATNNHQCLKESSAYQGGEETGCPQIVDEAMRKALLDPAKRRAFMQSLDNKKFTEGNTDGFLESQIHQINSRWSQLASDIDSGKIKVISPEEWGKRSSLKAESYGRQWPLKAGKDRREILRPELV